ncbi:substrate-binding periplasmic protein [Desulforegula conservatrix]|uniref:substrate-binding periplasmic protein n=1 Tax=Desulforegula conservatrix TaxID=153026 RepID=UPI0012ECB745|nr:transporter substrate-binding domain-containing protein [Desulforegula conservatrix]
MALKKRCFLLIFFFVACMEQSAISEPLEIGMLDFPPYYILGKNEEVKGGLLVDMLVKIFDRAGIEYTLAGYPPKRLYSNVGKGITHIWLGTLGVSEYEGKTIVSPKKMAEINLHVFSMNKSIPLPKSLNELKGKSVITIFGYNYGGVIKFLEDPANNIVLEPAKTHESAFMMLKMERAGFVLDYIEPAGEALSKLKLSDLSHAPITELPLYIHIAKTLPDAQQIMDRLMNAYEELKKEGKL